MRYGLLDRSIVVERFTEGSVTESGTVQGAWNELHTLRAAILEEAKDESREDFGDSSVETIRFRVPWVTDLTLADRVIHNAQTYDIRSIKPILRRRALEITCRRTGNGS